MCGGRSTFYTRGRVSLWQSRHAPVLRPHVLAADYLSVRLSVFLPPQSQMWLTSAQATQVGILMESIHPCSGRKFRKHRLRLDASMRHRRSGNGVRNCSLKNKVLLHWPIAIMIKYRRYFRIRCLKMPRSKTGSQHGLQASRCIDVTATRVREDWLAFRHDAHRRQS